MEDLYTFGTVFIGICACIITISGAVGAVSKAKNALERPADELEERLKLAEETIESHDKMLGRDKARIDEMDESIHLILGGVLQLLDHDIDGNNIGELKSQKSKIQDFLIKR